MRVPLRKGRLRSGELMWFILTDTTDENLANLHGLVYSPKLAYGLTGKGAREASIDRDGTFVFDAGKVDFSPDRSVVPRRCSQLLPTQGLQAPVYGGRRLFPACPRQECVEGCRFSTRPCSLSTSARRD